MGEIMRFFAFLVFVASSHVVKIGDYSVRGVIYNYSFIMTDVAVSHAPAVPPMRFGGLRTVFSLFHNLSIQIKASAASAVLLICLLALGANAYVTSTKSADGLRLLSHEVEAKMTA